MGARTHTDKTLLPVPHTQCVAHQDPGAVTNATPPSYISPGTDGVALQSRVAAVHVDERHTHTGTHTWVTPGPVWKWRLSGETWPPRASPLPACPLAVFERAIPPP